jgi:hypothetical protein
MVRSDVERPVPFKSDVFPYIAWGSSAVIVSDSYISLGNRGIGPLNGATHLFGGFSDILAESRRFVKFDRIARAQQDVVVVHELVTNGLHRLVTLVPVSVVRR